MANGHTLEIVDRGKQHVHRFWPTCSCGWFGVYRRRKQEAESQYRRHVNSHAVRKAPDRSGVQPRKLTPIDDLPEELR